MAIKFFRSVFIKGLIALLPIAITVLIAAWLVSGFESLFRPLVERLIPDDRYVPGMGMALGLSVVFLVGLLLQAILAQKAWSLGEQLLSRMPLLSHVFRATKQIMSYMTGAEMPQGGSVVLVDLGTPKARVLGLVTAETLRFDTNDENIAVFLPWSYQIGGFTVIVRRDAVTPVALTPQEALRFTLTAGIGGDGSTRGADRSMSGT